MVTDLTDQRNTDSKPERTQQIKSKLISTAEPKKISGTRDTNDLRMQKCRNETALVVQWIGICLPMQGTQVRSLVWEDSTCYGATTDPAI